MTKSQILAQAAILARRQGLSSTISNIDFLYGQALRDLCAYFDILEGEFTGNITDQYAITTLIPQFKAIRRVMLPGYGYESGVYDTGSNNWLVEVTPDELRELRTDTTQGVPQYYSIIHQVVSGTLKPVLAFYPTFSGSRSVKILAWQYYTGSESADPILGTIWDNAVINYLARLIALQVNDFELAGNFVPTRPSECTGLGKLAIEAILPVLHAQKRRLPRRVKYIDF